MSSFSTNSAEFSESDAGNVILLQIKVFSRNIKEAKLARYFTKVTARPSFALLRVIRRKKCNSLNIKMENMLQRFNCISFYLYFLDERQMR